MVAILEKGEQNADFHPMVDFIMASPLRTITESSLRRNLKLQDEEGISSLPDTELFKNLTLMGYNISPNQKFTFQKGNFPIIEGEGSGTPTEPHHTPSPEAPSPYTSHTSPSLRPVTTTSIPTVADEPASPQRDEVEIHQLKARVKLLEEREGLACKSSGDDAPIKGRRLDEEEVVTERVSSQTEEIRLDEGEVAAKKVSDDIEEMATVLITIDATSVLSSGGVQVVPTTAAVTPANVSISTGSRVVLTASTTISKATPIFATATTVTPYTTRKGKEKMVETHTPKKKKRLQEQIDIQDEEIAKIHVEEDLQQMIEGLDRTKKQKRDFYMAVIKSNLGWKVKDFRGMTFEEVEANFNLVWKQIEDFIPMGSKDETERIKRKCINLEQESAKKQKISEEVPEEVKSSDEVLEEKIKELIQLVPIEEVYVEALQVKHPIIDWNVHTEGHRSYWKITRLGGSSASYQFFVDMLKQIDREDLNQLWALVKEILSIRPSTDEKEMELWIELKRLYEPDVEDHLWTHTQHIMYAPVEWRLYDTCGVHHVMFKDLEIFMLVEKNYPLRKALALVMICYKLQVENYSQMATDLVREIQQITGTPSLQGD
nr:hypothetical protein [Tanacetum cinerariifolium]